MRFSLSLFYFLFLFFSPVGCIHGPETLPESEGASHIFEADDQIIFRALSRVIKDRGLGESRIDPEKGRLETDFLVQGGWRTKAVATVKKISRMEREVTFSFITEQRDSTPPGWKAKKLIGREQYENFFNELEMQIYREWYKGK